MWNGIAIGIGRSSFAGSFAGSYATRVTAAGGVVEALSCLNYIPNPLDNASLLIIPSGYKAGVAYSELPANGNGDLTWSRNSVANRTQSDGSIGSVAANVPRLSYMYGSCPALLLEPQRTNSIRNSTMQGASTSPSTLPTNWLNLNSGGLTRTVVGVGTENGLPYIDIRNNGTATGPLNSFSTENINIIAASSGQSWANSIYAKVIAQPNAPNSYQFQTLYYNAGVYVSETNNTYTPTTSLARYSAVNTVPAGTVTNVTQAIRFNLTIGNTYDFTIRIAAPQMELGAFATTWIDTTNASATRLTDTFSRNNIYTNGLISASGGTWYVELRNNISYTRDASDVGLFIGDTSNGATGNVLSIRCNSTQRLSINKRVSGSQTQLYVTLTDTIKVAIKWNGTSADVFVNGTKQVSATAYTTTVMEFFNATGADVPKFIQAMALYPTPISDADCEVLTGTSYSSYSAMATALGYTIL